jgi:hypothetical protein
MDDHIIEARENVGKSMIDLVSKIKNALGDKTKITSTPDASPSQILAQITELTKRSAQTALKIKACPAGTYTLNK